MTKVELNVGDKVSWIRPMTCVPHPEGKTDRDGKVLPVFRDKLEKGRVIGTNANGYSIRPDWLNNTKMLSVAKGIMTRPLVSKTKH